MELHPHIVLALKTLVSMLHTVTAATFSLLKASFLISFYHEESVLCLCPPLGDPNAPGANHFLNIPRGRMLPDASLFASYL